MHEQSDSNSPNLLWDEADAPYLTGEIDGIGGDLRQAVGDFVVDEIPAYEPNGEGEHLFLWIEKRDTSAEYLTRHLANTLCISTRDIGTAGLKDRRAVTRQYVSVPATCGDRLPDVETENIRVLHARKHRNKLRTGHLQGNRFSILIRDVADGALETAKTIGKRVEELGFPNYFGPQRFGMHGDTAKTGFELLTGKRSARKFPTARKRFLLRLSLSAAQSLLFNRVLADRLTDGILHRVLPGDVMQVIETGGTFVVRDPLAEQQRFDAKETVLTGPLFGPKMIEPTDAPAECENKLLAAHQLEPANFDRYRRFTSGSRRPYIVWPKQLRIDKEQAGLRFEFTLPAGVYATSLLREFMKPDNRG